MIKYLQKLIIINTIVFTACLMGCHQSKTSRSQKQPIDQEKIELKQSVTITASDIQFVVNAKTALIKPLSSGNYALIMENVKPYITYYTRRPNRSSGLATVSNFVNAWSVGNNSFATDNPNGVLTAGKVNGNDNRNGAIKVLTLNRPEYSPSKQVLRFVITPVGLQNQFIIKNPSYQNVTLTIN